MEAMMKSKRTWLWLLLLVPSLGVGVKVLHLTWFDQMETSAPPSNVFADAGFLTLQMTLSYHAPGSLYAINNLSEGFVDLRPACEVDVDELKSVIQTYETTDVSMAVEQKLSAGSKVAPEKWAKLKIDADLTKVQEIWSVFSNSRVQLLSTETIRKLRDSYLSRDECFAAVKDELSRGYDVCQTEAVIVSDLVYEVNNGASGSIGLDALIDRVVGFVISSELDRRAFSRVTGGQMYHAVKLHRPRLSESCILLNTAVAQAEENQGR